eukprot:jgi/Mesen1/535/ME000104S10618
MDRPEDVPAWTKWLDAQSSALQESNLLRSLRPLRLVALPDEANSYGHSWTAEEPAIYHARGPWDSSAVQVEVGHATLHSWLSDAVCSGQDAGTSNLTSMAETREPALYQNGAPGAITTTLKLFSGNDYLGLGSHPAVRASAAKAALQYGMGPRSSALVCGYTHHHRALETDLARLKGTEECLLTPTGFAANMALITALASPAPQRLTSTGTVPRNLPLSQVQAGGTPFRDVHVELAVFSDELNHASIIDGVRLVQRQGGAALHVYRHNDMAHLHDLLKASSASRKVVITDSLFSMDGDFAPMTELAALRRKHGFLWVVDEAHATLVCGDHGGGASEAFGVEAEVDLHVGTLSKAVGCHGGFIACSQKWKHWVQSRGRSFIFSTALPVPVVAAARTALLVAAKEGWRQRAVWDHVRYLSQALGSQFTSPIVPLVIGGAQEALDASRALLRAGFHVPAIRPPTVAAGSSRLRIALSASHTPTDVVALVAALPESVKLRGSSLLSFKAPLNLWYPGQQRDYKGVQHGVSTDERPSSGSKQGLECLIVNTSAMEKNADTPIGSNVAHQVCSPLCKYSRCKL